MGFVRFSAGTGSFQFGYRIADRIVSCPSPLEGTPDSAYLFSGESTASSTGTSQLESRQPITAESPPNAAVFDRSEVDLAVPTAHSTIVRLDGCYRHDVTDDGFNHHVEDAGFNELDYPSLWVAPESTLTPHEGTVRVPSRMSAVYPGVELGVVIDSHAHALDPDEALDAVGGFTVCMDLAVHDAEPGLEGYRMFDTSLPCGPELVVPEVVDPETLSLGIRVDGEPVDVRSTTEFRFSLAELVSYVSEVLSLSPGDLITTGTPIRGAPALDDGADVQAWVESVGTLQTTVEWEGDQ